VSQIKVKDVLKLLKTHNFHELGERQIGDHHRYIDDHGHKVTVKYSTKKATIPPKTYSSILRQAGLK